MFNTGSRPTITKLVVDLGLELVDSSADSNADPAEVKVWVRAYDCDNKTWQ